MTDSNRPPLRIAVLGVGALGRHHARILSNLPGVELAAICDTNAEQAKEIAETYSVPWITDRRELPDLDGIVVATPTTLHREHATEFLRKGVGVLCEKPLATTLEECEAILKARDEGGAALLVGHIEHFNPGVEALAREVTEPGFIEVHRLGVFVPRSLDVDVVLDLMIHDIEIVQSLVGRPVTRVEAKGVDVLTSHVDICNARLTFDGGCVANLTASRISREKVRKLRVFQPRAYIAVDYAQQAVEQYKVVEVEGKRAIQEVPVHVENAEPLLRELQHFVAVLQGEAEPLVGGEAAMGAVSVARQILRCTES